MTYYKCFDNYDTKTKNTLIAMEWHKAELDLSKEIDNLIVPNYWTWKYLSEGTLRVPFILLKVKQIKDHLPDLSPNSDMIRDLYDNNIKKFEFFFSNDIEVDDPILIVRNNNGSISVIDGNHRIVGYCMRETPPKIKVLEGRL